MTRFNKILAVGLLALATSTQASDIDVKANSQSNLNSNITELNLGSTSYPEASTLALIFGGIVILGLLAYRARKEDTNL